MELQSSRQEDAPLRAHLAEAELTAEDWKPAFGALSYTWGAPVFDTELVVDEKSLRITKGLAAALKRLRPVDGTFLLWIDQVCINQQDMTERNSQVKLMGQIYTKAAKLIAWVGEGVENAPPRQPQGQLHQRTKQEIDVTESQIRKLINQLAIAYNKWTKSGDTRDGDELQRAGLEKYGLPPKDDPAYSAFLRILQQPYFSRGWIAQELALPRGHRSVFFGTMRMPLGHFCRAVEMCFHLGFINTKDNRNVGYLRFRRLMSMQNMISPGTSRDMLKLLLSSRMTVTTDPRDKIYCLLGLASDSKLLGIEPNYRDSVENVYRNFTLRYIDAYSNLDILTVPHRCEKHHDSPSWIIDWRLHCASCTVSLDGREQSQTCQYRATKGTQACTTTSADPNVIGLSGYSIDTVIECGRRQEPTDEKTYRGAFLADLNRRLKLLDWKRIARLHTSECYITGETTEDALIGCLTAGTPIDLAPTPMSSLNTKPGPNGCSCTRHCFGFSRSSHCLPSSG
jgi:hypothetical protein